MLLEFFMFSDKKMTISLRKYSFIKNSPQLATTTMILVFFVYFYTAKISTLILFSWSN